MSAITRILCGKFSHSSGPRPSAPPPLGQRQRQRLARPTSPGPRHRGMGHAERGMGGRRYRTRLDADGAGTAPRERRPERAASVYPTRGEHLADYRPARARPGLRVGALARIPGTTADRGGRSRGPAAFVWQQSRPAAFVWQQSLPQRVPRVAFVWPRRGACSRRARVPRVAFVWPRRGARAYAAAFV